MRTWKKAVLRSVASVVAAAVLEALPKRVEAARGSTGGHPGRETIDLAETLRLRLSKRAQDTETPEFARSIAERLAKSELPTHLHSALRATQGALRVARKRLQASR